ncbi:MAG TPA: GspH/FimT family pseudopilin [Burkholderiaceae bacterium]|nr:GspH/FimT family pseudopilin [Burkholderiaceae bacterium]
MLVSRPRSPRRAAGFTLIELVTAITVMAILATLATPSFQVFVANQRIRNASFDLMATLSLVRSQAITLNANVDLQRTGSRWDAGWKVTDGTSTFQLQEAYKNISITDSGSLAAVTYGRDGRTVTAGTRFTIAPSVAISGVTSRCVSLGLSGVPSSRQGPCS